MAGCSQRTGQADIWSDLFLGEFLLPCGWKKGSLTGFIPALLWVFFMLLPLFGIELENIRLFTCQDCKLTECKICAVPFMLVLFCFPLSGVSLCESLFGLPEDMWTLLNKKAVNSYMHFVICTLPWISACYLQLCGSYSVSLHACTSLSHILAPPRLICFSFLTMIIHCFSCLSK